MFRCINVFSYVSSGVSVPLHVNTSDEFSFKLVKAARCRIMVVDSIKDRKQVLEWRKTFPQLKTIIQCGKDKIDTSDDLIAVRFILLDFISFNILFLEQCFSTSMRRHLQLSWICLCCKATEASWQNGSINQSIAYSYCNIHSVETCYAVQM